MTARNTSVLRRDEHCISRGNIDRDALKVLYRLRNHGHEAYLVGGGVRDLLLGRPPKDFDIGTGAHPGEIRKLFRNSILIGRRFRLAHIRFGNKVIEASTFRCDPDSLDTTPGHGLYQHRDNTFGTPEEDARRRDFTVNGLFYDVRTYSVIDHVSGLADLKKKLIRCIGDPDIRFREDPVRMVRAVRFASRLGFRIEKKTYRAITRHREEIAKASPARLLEEMYKLFPYGSGRAAFKLLHETGLLSVLFPEIARYLSRGRRGGVLLWRHLEALDAGGSVLPEPTPPLLLACLFYDIFLRALDKRSRDGDPVVHEEVAREALEAPAERFRMPKKVVYRIVHMFADQRRLNPASRRRFSRRGFVSRLSFPETLALYEVDLAARGGDLTLLKPWIRLHEECRRDAPPARRSRGGGRRRRQDGRGGVRRGQR